MTDGDNREIRRGGWDAVLREVPKPYSGNRGTSVVMLSDFPMSQRKRRRSPELKNLAERAFHKVAVSCWIMKVTAEK